MRQASLVPPPPLHIYADCMCSASSYTRSRPAGHALLAWAPNSVLPWAMCIMMPCDISLWCNVSSLAESLISTCCQPRLLGHRWLCRPWYTALDYDWGSAKLQKGNRMRSAQNWSSVCKDQYQWHWKAGRSACSSWQRFGGTSQHAEQKKCPNIQQKQTGLGDHHLISGGAGFWG